MTTYQDESVTYSAPMVKSHHDYMPFGMEFYHTPKLLGKANYRYGFNGKEKDSDGEWGDLDHLDFGARIYNPAIARWMSIDPLAHRMPAWSPYNFAFDNPILYIDPDGRNPEKCCPPPGYNSMNEWYYINTDVIYETFVEPVAGLFDGFFLETKETHTRNVTSLPPAVKATTTVDPSVDVEFSVTHTSVNQFERAVNDRWVDPETGLVYSPTPFVSTTHKPEVKIITSVQVKKKVRPPLVLTLKGQYEYGFLSQDEVLKATATLGVSGGGQSAGLFSELSSAMDENGSVWRTGAQIQLTDDSNNGLRLRFGVQSEVDILPNPPDEEPEAAPEVDTEEPSTTGN